MFEVWETGDPPGMLAETTSLDEALERLDAECSRRHAQAVANDEGAVAMRHRFEIRDQAGMVLAALAYSPDTSRPYESILIEELLRGEL